MDQDETPVLRDDEQKRRQRTRSIAIALALAGLAALFFVVTLVRLGSDVMNRAM